VSYGPAIAPPGAVVLVDERWRMMYTHFEASPRDGDWEDTGHVTERWATFDCYGTLIDWDGGVRAALTRQWPGRDTNRLLKLYHAVEPLIQEDRSLSYRHVQARSMRAIAAIEGLPLGTNEEYSLGESLPDWPAFPEVPRSLLALREAGWNLAILSNTDPDLLAASLLQIGVPIDLCVTAAEAGSYKPAPGHWETFFSLSGADPARHIHVAASLFHDIVPCAALGIPAVWINRQEEISDIPRTAELSDLSALPEILETVLARH
jgi:2-haloacid dehalogenase